MATYGSGVDVDETTVKLSKAERASSAANVFKAPISDGQRKALEQWLNETIGERLTFARRMASRWENWRKTLAAERPKPSIRRSASNLSVPLMIWARGATIARIDRAVWGLKPTVSVKSYPGASADVEDASRLTPDDLKHIANFLEHELYNPNALNGRTVGRQVSSSAVTVGSGVWKVYVEPARVLRTPTGNVTVSPRPRWEYVALADTIYWDGYGTNMQAMPYVGHLKTVTRVMMDEWEALGYYDKEPVAAARALYGKSTTTDVIRAANTLPTFLQPHDVAELYLEFPLKEGEYPAPVIVDFHVMSGRVLRVDWNRNPLGYRPLFTSQFSEPPDAASFVGQGVCEKLEGAQEEADMTHNIGIEAAKRSAANLVVVKGSSDLEAQVTDAMDTLPGHVVSGDNPDGDINSVELGNPNAAQFLVSLADHTTVYVMQILGLSGASQGDVAEGKRVPASLGMNISQEGKVPIAHATQTTVESMEAALYLTIELYKQAMPRESMALLMPPETAHKLYGIVFAPRDVDVRKQLAIVVSAQDAASEEEKARQEILYLTQFLFGFYDRLISYGQLALQLPAPVQAIMLDVIGKMQNAVKLLLARIESVQDPSSVIPDVAEMIGNLNRMGGAISGTLGRGSATASVPSRNEQFGAGVA